MTKTEQRELQIRALAWEILTHYGYAGCPWTGAGAPRTDCFPHVCRSTACKPNASYAVAEAVIDGVITPQEAGL